MKRSGILNTRLAEAVAKMGHYDVMLVCGPAYPVNYTEVGDRLIDLAVAPGLPDTPEVLQAIRGEMWVEKIVFIQEAFEYNTRFVTAVKDVFPDALVATETNDWFHDQGGRGAKFIVRTGGCNPWGNVGLVAGIPFVEWVANADGVVPDDWRERYELNRRFGAAGLDAEPGTPAGSDS